MTADERDRLKSISAHAARKAAFDRWWKLSSYNGTLPKHPKSMARQAYYAAWGGALAESVAAEREACAKVADDWLVVWNDRNPVHVTAQKWACDAVRDIADAIRLRSATPPVIAEQSTPPS